MKNQKPHACALYGIPQKAGSYQKNKNTRCVGTTRELSVKNMKVPMYKEVNILIAGFGGQGIMFLGKIIANAAVLDGKNITFMRSYGAEIRGGTAYCMVRISDNPIYSPVFEKAQVSIMMNKPSFVKFRKRLSKKGISIVNESLADQDSGLKDPRIYRYSFSDIALSLGDVKAANSIALGVMLKKTDIITKESVINIFKQAFRGKEKALDVNLKAMELGWKKN